MPIVIVLLFSLFLGGCFSIEARLQSEDPSVKAMLEGDDCAYIFFGFGLGKVTVDKARADGRPVGQDFSPQGPPVKITKVRYVELIDTGVLGLIGARCINVVGEP